MKLCAAPLMLIVARAKRRPGRWLLTALGVAVALAFAGAVAAEGTIAGDEGARSVLAGLSPLDRAVRVTWQGVATPAVGREARSALDGVGLRAQTQVVLLGAVRLSGSVVQPVAVEPLSAAVSPARVGPCRPASCPVLLVGAGVRARRLATPGAVLDVVSPARLISAAPLGFIPSGDESPLVLSGDVAGLDRLPGLGGAYRTHSWLAELTTADLQSWQLAPVERRLRRAQAAVSALSPQFSMEAPFAALDSARARASAAPRRLLLAGGGALAVLAAFIVLAAGALRRDQRAEVERLRAAGARTSQVAVFALGEAAWLCAAGALAGAGLAVLVAALLASATGVPAGGVLLHSILTPVGAAALLGGWACATTLVGLVLLVPGRHGADVAAVAAAAALAFALVGGGGGSGSDSLALLLAPLGCLAAGVLTYRIATLALRAAERLSRRGPVTARLALVGLARAPSGPSLAIACIAVSTGLGTFAIVYRSTLLRGAADQAANEVPLDATVSAAPDFTTPLEAAPLARWRRLAGGEVLPVRRTYASFAGGAGAVTVPALGVPAAALTLIHGWRASDGSAPLSGLARRLTPPGPVRVPGPVLPPGARSLALRSSAPSIAVTITADLRDRSGAIRPVVLGTADATPRTLTARIPPGRWEVQALELDEPTGLEITAGHQNAENPAAATQFGTSVTLGPLRAVGASERPGLSVSVGRWRGVGAAGTPRAASSPGSGSDSAVVRFAASGEPGVIRPRQPSDTRPVPVLVDPRTAATATRSGLIALTVDELPVSARVVGVLKRFPTIPAGTAGFVIADEATLDSALDAQLPGQGRTDELWIAGKRLGPLRAALRLAPLARLGVAFRGAIENRLRAAPITRGVLGTLVAATIVSAALAALALLASLLGSSRDPRVERDLEDQGVGPRVLRRELRLRLLIAAASGVGAGLAIGIVLARLAVAAVAVADARPPLVAVAPWAELAGWGLAAVAVLALVSMTATRWLVGRRRTA